MFEDKGWFSRDGYIYISMCISRMEGWFFFLVGGDWVVKILESDG